MRRQNGWLPALLAGLVVPMLAPQALGQANARTDTRTGKDVVETVCASCHAAGKNGAPRIGDRKAWIPRMKRGLHELTFAAIRGHDGMPARGGRADLTDVEIHNAIAYMFNPVADASAASAAPAPSGASPGTREATVDGIRVNLGLISAEKMRAFPRGSVEASMHGGVPSGSGYHHITVRLSDAAKGTPIAGAQVEVEVSQAASGTQKVALEPMAINNAPTYGNYLRLASTAPAGYTVRIRRPGSKTLSEAKFGPQAD